LPDTPVFREIYNHSIVISYIARELPQELKVGNPRLLSTIGLLHEIGNTLLCLLKEGSISEKLVIISIDQFPEPFVKVLNSYLQAVE